MLVNTMQTYPFTVGYYSTINTNLSGTIPQWEDTFIKDINVQLGNTNVGLGKLAMYSKEALSPGYVLKNFRDINGNTVFPQQPNSLNIDTSAYRINTCDPQINAFGWIEGFACIIQQLNLVRAV